MPPRRPGRRWLARTLAILLSVLATAVVLELVLRLFGCSPAHVNPMHGFNVGDARLGYRGKSDYVGRFSRPPDFDVVVAQDAHGFRAAAHANDPTRCRHKALVFGDSYLWGWGVGQGEVLTDEWSRLAPTLDVRNFGVNSSGTAMQFELFQMEGEAQLAPGDAVVLLFCQNDFHDNVRTDRLHGELRDGHVVTVRVPSLLRTSAWLTVKEHSYLLSYVANCIDRWSLSRRQLQQRDAFAASADLGSQPLVAVTSHYLAAFRDVVVGKGGNFVVALIPGQAELGEMAMPAATAVAADAAYRAAFVRIAAALHLDTLDLLPPLRAAKVREPGQRVTFANDPHWTPFGHRVVAAALAEHTASTLGDH
jgi:hypothetical protein